MSGGGKGHLVLLDFGNVLLNVLIILVFNSKWLQNYQNDLKKTVKHIKILTLLRVLILVFSTFASPHFINLNFARKVFPPKKLSADTHVHF